MGLRPDQTDLLAHHRRRAAAALSELATGVEVRRGMPDPKSPAVGRFLESEPGQLVSCAIALLAGEHQRLEAVSKAAEEPPDAPRALQHALDDAIADVPSGLTSRVSVPGIALERLAARRLPFSAADAELLLDLELERTVFWRLPFAVAAAERVLATEPGSPVTLAALERAARRLDEHPKTSYEPDLRQARIRIRALVAGNVPGGLLDRSIVEEGDAWAEPARELLAAHEEQRSGVQDVLAHFAAAKGSRPTKTWIVRMAEISTERPGTARLSRELLELVLDVDVVPTPEAVPWPPRWLLAPGNEILLKGAAWSLRFVEDEWVVQLLGRVTLRAAARSPDDAVTTPLSAALAGAAIDSLIELDSENARAELRRLLTELSRRDLVKRIGTALGEDTGARREQLRLDKQRAVRAKASPRSGQEQRAASERVRTELAPRLWDSGFTARSGRTFWRHHPDRVEVLHVASTRGELSLETGVWFAAPRRRQPQPTENGLAYPDPASCDLRARFDAENLVAAAMTAEGWFLRWDEVEGVLAFLLSSEHDGVTSCGAPGSPARDYLIGYLAAPGGSPELARAHLLRAAAWERETLEQRRSLAPRDITPEWEAWVEALERDASDR